MLGSGLENTMIDVAVDTLVVPARGMAKAGAA